MQIVPIKELKDGAKISEMCHSTNEAIHITKNGYADMVIMSAEVFEEMSRLAQANKTAALVQEGIEAIQRGECKDAFDAIEAMRRKYGL